MLGTMTCMLDYANLHVRYLPWLCLGETIEEAHEIYMRFLEKSPWKLIGMIVAYLDSQEELDFYAPRIEEAMKDLYRACWQAINLRVHYMSLTPEQQQEIDTVNFAGPVYEPSMLLAELFRYSREPRPANVGNDFFALMDAVRWFINNLVRIRYPEDSLLG